MVLLIVISFVFAIIFKMDNCRPRVWKATRDNSIVWIDQEMLDIVSTFINEDGVYHALMRWVPPQIGRCFPKGIKRICNKYDGCVILWISLIGFRIPFNEFEVDVINLLVISHSQLHLVRWAYLKFFQYLCEYKKDAPTLTLFFHLFKAQRRSIDSGQIHCLISHIKY